MFQQKKKYNLAYSVFSSVPPSPFFFAVSPSRSGWSHNSASVTEKLKHSCILHIVRVLAELVSFNIFTNSTTTNVISINEKPVLCKTPASRGPSGGHLSPQHLWRTNRMVEFKVNMSSQD